MSHPETMENPHGAFPGQQAGIRQAPGGGGHQYPGHMGAPVMGPADLGAGNLANQFQGLAIGAHGGMAHHGHGMAQMGGAPTYMMPDGHYLLPMAPAGHPVSMDGYGAPPGVAPYMGHHHGQFANYIGVPMMPYTPGGRNHGVAVRHDRTSDVPGLENRRGSYSTNESTPATPYYPGMAQRESGPRVAGFDRSSYTTPSPHQMGLGLHPMDAAKGAGGAAIISLHMERTIEDLLKKEPAVPKAVPAVFTPPGQMKSLDQSLENRIPGNRNVYIRGLHPTTDDSLLYAFASRFGPVETSKAIIDTSTGACKGFGFAKFYEVRNSEICIRGFHRLGYEVGFARESFNSRLKAEGDECSTNLYISNLPKSISEVELANIFQGYEILSSKILRDSMGNSRGVGFARFDSRDVCDAVIKKYHGVSIGDEGLLMNIRYADTPAQKELKRITAERRQFRTNEYNIGAYGTSLVGYQPNMYSGQGPAWRRPSYVPASRCIVGPSGPSSSSMTASRGDSGSHRRALTSSDVIVTPTSSDPTDVGVTAQAGQATAVNGSTQSSPVVKNEKI